MCLNSGHWGYCEDIVSCYRFKIFDRLISKNFWSKCPPCLGNICILDGAHTVPGALEWRNEIRWCPETCTNNVMMLRNYTPDDFLRCQTTYLRNIWGASHSWHFAHWPQQVPPLNHSADSPSKANQQLQYHENRFYGGIPSLKDECTFSCTFVCTLPDVAITQSRGVSPAEDNKCVCATSEFWVKPLIFFHLAIITIELN